MKNPIPVRAGPIGRALALALAAGAIGPWPASAQIPDEFTNLQFFPEDISRDELLGNMRRFSFALGVRCQYCHFGGDGISFDGVEFASDEKPEKRRARYMLRMTSTINATLLPDLPERRTPNVQVECRTCHRGIERPRMIDDILRERIASEGVEAAVSHYRKLRDEAYGTWSYDFGEWVINDLATEFFEDAPETTAALMRMNVEYHAESISAWASLGQAEDASGNRDGAIAAYRKALELSPDNQRLIRALRELGIDP